jgi:hypothetical protein
MIDIKIGMIPPSLTFHQIINLEFFEIAYRHAPKGYQYLITWISLLNQILKNQVVRALFHR